MFWVFKKNKILNEIKYQIFLEPIKRNLKTKIVIKILEDLIDNNRTYLLSLIPDTTFNPLNDGPLLLHLVSNWHLMNYFPEHKYFIKKLLK